MTLIISRLHLILFSTIIILLYFVFKVRFARTMETAKFDKGLKEDRNLNWGDSEFYEYKEVIAGFKSPENDGL